MRANQPLLQVYFRRILSGLIAGVSLILVVGGGIGLLRAGAEVPQAVQWFMWSILALLLYGIVVGVRQLVRPPLMFIANNEGIVTYYLSDHNTYTGSGVLIPWANISNMALEKRRGTVSGVGAGNRSDVWVIACTLKEDAAFDLEKHSSGRYASDGKRVICLDAYAGTVRLQELLDRLRSLWQGR
ncbi:MAG: hypothetical protein WCL27_14640 [Betaproteobacteria bacterium]